MSQQQQQQSSTSSSGHTSSAWNDNDGSNNDDDDDDSNNNLRWTTNNMELDTVIANDMNQMSITEREHVYERIHGVEKIVEETEELILRSLNELQIEIDTIKEKDAYEMALLMMDERQQQQQEQPQQIETTEEPYLTSRTFRLMFLRSENFDIPKAAKRFVLYHERILQYFGTKVLGRPIYYTDLTDETITYLNKGIVQHIPYERDSAGRTVFFQNYLDVESNPCTTQTWIQTFVYLYHCILENDDMTQKRGLVFISYMIGNTMTGTFQFDNAKAGSDMLNWMPMKFNALHVCLRSTIMKFVSSLILGKDMRQRIRIHDGTHMECMYALQGFGIPVDKLPIIMASFGGEIEEESSTPQTTTGEFLKWLEQRQTKEMLMKNARESLDIIGYPKPQDVALWRGRIYQLHPGNIRMRNLIDEFRDEYDASFKGDKAQIAMRIVNIIKTVDGGRFLTQQPPSQQQSSSSKDETNKKNDLQCWIEVSDHEAVKRVCKAFRSARARQVLKKETTTSVSTSKSTKDIADAPNKRLRMSAQQVNDTLSSLSDDALSSSKFSVRQFGGDDDGGWSICLIVPERVEY